MFLETLHEIYLKHPFVTTDSRAIQPGCIFFALKGERFDGNSFATQAIEKGAAYAVIDNPDFNTNEHCILVEDALLTLQKLATLHRNKFAIPVLGITGSNGKTTTKELVSAVLGSHYNTHFTKGNFNNHIGVPLTLLQLKAETEIAVIEMGANHQGEIDFLSNLTNPTHGLITNIGKAHLEGFGGLEGVKKGKSELYRYLAKHHGIIFVNQNEAHLSQLMPPHATNVVYGWSRENEPDNPYFIKLDAVHPTLRVSFYDDHGKNWDIQSQLVGQYNVSNISTAVAIGIYFKVPPLKIVAAIESYIPSNNRSQIIQSGSNTIILDAYNANPTSMFLSIQNFAEMAFEKKVAILGAMKELGEESQQEHLEIVNKSIDLKIDQLVLLGEDFRNIAKLKNLPFFEDLESLKIWFKKQSFDKTGILIKGSRSNQLEQLLQP